MLIRLPKQRIQPPYLHVIPNLPIPGVRLKLVQPRPNLLPINARQLCDYSSQFLGHSQHYYTRRATQAEGDERLRDI